MKIAMKNSKAWYKGYLMIRISSKKKLKGKLKNLFKIA